MEDRKMKGSTPPQAADVASPYQGRRLMDDAWQRGRRARADGERRTACPFGDYPGKAFAKAWGEGWDSLGPPSLPIHVQVIPARPPGPTLWPAGKPFPTHYRRPQTTVIPCERCRAVLGPSGSQAVVVDGRKGGTAYLWCRVCGFRFKLPETGPSLPAATPAAP